MGVQLPSEPITRKEQYLAKAAGQAVEVPSEPITREEAYLDAIAKGGGGGGGYVLPVASADTLGGVKVGDHMEIDENGTLNPKLKNVYSSTPQKIGTWNDKDLYRVLVSCGSGPNSTIKKTTFDKTNKTIVSIKGIAIGTSATYKETLPVPYVAAGRIQDQLQVYYDGVDSFCLVSSGDFSGYDITLIVDYFTSK